jgi:outer membrane protein OmpU
MNKLAKIGASALCGSLAAIASAQAGEMVVTGGATATYSKGDQTTNGNPFGMNTGLTFTGNGELDNGTTFTMTVTHADKAAYSAANISMTVPSLGSLKIDMGSGGSGLDRIDDMIPTAWEETNGTNVGTGLQTVSGVGGKANIEWSLEEGMFFGDGMQAHIAFSPRADGGLANDKATGGAGNGQGAGYDVVLQHSGLADGLNIFGGYSVIAREQDTSLVGGNKKGDRAQMAYGATYAFGGATLGYQYSKDDLGIVEGTNYYENSAFGISFAVNDNLSVSVGAHNSERNHADGTTTDNEATSAQASYTMGGASIKFARTVVDNADYSTAVANDKDGYSVALTLAF